MALALPLDPPAALASPFAALLDAARAAGGIRNMLHGVALERPLGGVWSVDALPATAFPKGPDARFARRMAAWTDAVSSELRHLAPSAVFLELVGPVRGETASPPPPSDSLGAALRALEDAVLDRVIGDRLVDLDRCQGLVVNVPLAQGSASVTELGGRTPKNRVFTLNRDPWRQAAAYWLRGVRALHLSARIDLDTAHRRAAFFKDVAGFQRAPKIYEPIGS